MAKFKWSAVAKALEATADEQSQLSTEQAFLNEGQQASLREIAQRICTHGMVIADDVGMGKTRIATKLIDCVVKAGGRVAVVVPPGLGFQWQKELKKGGVNAPPILRSLWKYIDAWREEEGKDVSPWFDHRVVVISHALVNWRLGGNPDLWRWGMLPELYRVGLIAEGLRLPNGYPAFHQSLNHFPTLKNAAESIGAGQSSQVKAFVREFRDSELKTLALDAVEYHREGRLKAYLEQVVGIGLGEFDLIVIDEAHKSRGADSMLSCLLDQVLSKSKDARILSMTATPVELALWQWEHTLKRLGLGWEHITTEISPIISTYARAVETVKRTLSSDVARAGFKQAAQQFEEALSPYLIRRDKRKDPMVIEFADKSKLELSEYRQAFDIRVQTASLATPWKNAVCAAEALSFMHTEATDIKTKRMRLTMGNGHGIEHLLHAVKPSQLDEHHPDADVQDGSTQVLDSADLRKNGSKDQRQARAQWWVEVMTSTFERVKNPLYEHPSILAAVQFIERQNQVNEKVLVFGRFTEPMRALVDLLNAREMLRSLKEARPWPLAKITERHLCAVIAAQQQLHQGGDISADLAAKSEGELNELLQAQYVTLSAGRKRFRRGLIDKLRQAIANTQADADISKAVAGFDAYLKASNTDSDVDQMEQDLHVDHPLALLAMAMYESVENKEIPVESELVQAFTELMHILRDAEHVEGEEQDFNKLWPQYIERLKEEFQFPQGGIARLMHGETEHFTRRRLQSAFNRQQSNLRVLVAQSVVGREGLNLHEACRIVVLLHPEWNPGIVEQQIGRVDRLGSHWAKQMMRAIETKAEKLPRIEIHSVIFEGTYDEHHWQVLQQRSDDLRAQLHGVIIPPSTLLNANAETKAWADELAAAAPNFYPGSLNRI